MINTAGAKSFPSLATYFILAFLISWGAIFLAVGAHGFPVTEDQLPVLIVAMLLGPSAAGAIASFTAYGRRGLRAQFSGLVHWRVSFVWYALAILIAPLSTLVVLLGLASSPFSLATALSTAADKSALVLMWLPAALLVAFFEELGWTGFAVPQMRKKFSLFASGLLVGLLWGAWHFLVNLEADTFGGVLPIALLVARLFTWLPAYRILMVWVFDQTQSQLVVTLMHMSLVATTGIIDPVAQGESLLVFLLGKAILFWLLVAVVFLRKQRRARMAI